MKPPFVDFRDASFGPCSYKCTILHCLRGLQTGIQLGWFDYKTFNLKDYEFYEKVENGDFNWIVPGKFIAFSGTPLPLLMAQKAEGRSPPKTTNYLEEFGGESEIRLNKKQYDA